MDDFQIERLTENFVDEVFMLESKLLGKASRQKISDSIASSTLNYFILKINNSVVGFYEVSVIPPEAEIYDIAVKEEFQGKGIGKLLLKHLIDFCKSKNVNTIFLEVNNINNKAIITIMIFLIHVLIFTKILDLMFIQKEKITMVKMTPF